MNHNIKSVVKWMQEFEGRINAFENKIEEISLEVSGFNDRLEKLESVVFAAPAEIQRVEKFNSETVPDQRENLKMNYEDKLLSIKNAVAILPPNLQVSGRHTAGNVSAICGFKVDEAMLSEAYRVMQ